MNRTSRSVNARPERYTCSAANGSPDAFSGMQIASANAESESVGGCEAVRSGNSQIVLPFCWACAVSRRLSGMSTAADSGMTTFGAGSSGSRLR